MKATEYTVLARKYRPQTFKDLIGQDALVRTLTNAIKQDRLAHAYILTGIRGVGKTSTARIIAKALNCTGEDGKGGATPEPCGKCSNCVAIAESRSVDVIEMDAASRTGVNDIRDIIDNTGYKPVAARYKIYIIDEVHMLSKSAFNALLKTLEEPPPHVKFIFATTEVRKIPVTIISRCQRFDLPRIDAELLKKHLQGIAEKEKIKVSDETLGIIVNVAEGSVRDALSLLDQAIAHSGKSRDISGEQVQKMLGLLGKENLLALFQKIAAGDVKTALTTLKEMYNAGSDPVMVLNDLLEATHFTTQAKIIPDLQEPIHFSKQDFDTIKELSSKLEIPYLTRCWQILLKGLQEVQYAANPLMAVEMIIVRVAYSANMPNPGDLVKSIKDQQTNFSFAKPPAVQTGAKPEMAPAQNLNPENFEKMVDMFREKGELFLYNWLQNEVHPVSFEPGRLEIRLTDAAPRDLPNRLMMFLRKWTGRQWIVMVSNEKGEQTIKQRHNEKVQDEKAQALNDPQVKAILETFPDAKVVGINKILPKPAEKSGESENESTKKQESSK